MVKGTGITKAFTGQNLLEDIDFLLGNNVKVGVVGKNGCGKTTLFKIIIGQEQIDAGNIQVQGEFFGYIPQEFSFPDQLVGEYLETFLENTYDFYKIDILATELSFENFDPYQTIATLSEGQQMKLKMIEVLLGEPTMLLIDEPTNHLDIEGILWFEHYIKRLTKTVVMISHDRSFLNHTVDEIWEIENKKLLRFVGDYDNYKEEKLKLIDKWNVEYVRFLKHKKKLEQLLDTMRGIKDGKARGKAVGSVKKRIDREITKQEKEKYIERKIAKVTFDTDITANKLMVRFDNVSKMFGEITVFKDLSFEIWGGEKIWLFGPNGAGKTTAVKLIIGEEAPTLGKVCVGENIKVGYFAQKQTHLDYDKTVLDYFIEETGCYYGKVFGVLKKFLFSGDDLKKKIGSLSPGQRARFAFAVFAYNDYDLLILDEPTNHLDIETKEVIEESLLDYKGTLLLVSHDRFFVERVGVDRVLNVN